jgi:hypothetical protein
LLYIDPIYLSPRYGILEKTTCVKDDLSFLNHEALKRSEYYISKIVIYYDIGITAMEVEYVHKLTGDKTKSSHYSKGFRSGNDKVASLQLNSDDYINYVKITYHSSLTSLGLKTFSNKVVNVGTSWEYDKVVE